MGAYLEDDGSADPELWVDANHILLAKALTSRELPGAISYAQDPEAGKGTEKLDVDAAFNDIVAGMDLVSDSPVAPWPAMEDADQEPEPRRPSSRLIRRAQPLEPQPIDPELALAGAADAEDLEADPPTVRDEEHFVPPVPPAIPHGEAIDRFAWLGLIGGPIAFLVFAFVDFGLGSILQVAAAGAFIGGCVTLLLRMGDRPSRADDWDDGAVV